MSEARAISIPAEDREESPLCATGALAHALAAASRGRMRDHLAVAALARVDLLERRWAVRAGVCTSGTAAGRAAVLAAILARIDAETRALPEIDRRALLRRRPLEPAERRAVVDEHHRAPSPVEEVRAGDAVAELRTLNFDLWEVA
jgi:hypothetical protein